MRSLIVSIALTFVAPLAVASGEPSIADLAWMEGSWRGTEGGVSMEEVWMGPGGGVMLGMHRDIGAKRTSFEFARIAETPDGIVFFASPGGRPPTPFTLVESSAGRAVFANPDHDFPKRILYWREGAKLCARVEGDEGAEAEQWCWERAR